MLKHLTALVFPPLSKNCCASVCKDCSALFLVGSLLSVWNQDRTGTECPCRSWNAIGQESIVSKEEDNNLFCLRAKFCNACIWFFSSLKIVCRFFTVSFTSAIATRCVFALELFFGTHSLSLSLSLSLSIYIYIYIYIYPLLFFPIPSLCNSFLFIHNYMLLSTSSVIIWRRSSISFSFWEDHQPQTKQLETMCFWVGILTIYWVLKKDEIGINVTQQRS